MTNLIFYVVLDMDLLKLNKRNQQKKYKEPKIKGKLKRKKKLARHKKMKQGVKNKKDKR